MVMKHLAAALGVLAASVVALASPASSADFFALSNNGRTLSLVDIDKGKVARSVELAKRDQLTTIAYQPDTKEVWGITVGKSLVRMKAKTFDLFFRSEPIGDALQLETPFLEWVNGRSYVVLSNKRAAPITPEGALEEPFAMFRNPDGAGFPTLASFTFITNEENPSKSRAYGVDAETDSLYYFPLTMAIVEKPAWKYGPKLSKKIDAPLAFETIRENGVNQGFAVLGKTLWSVNLTNGKFTRPRDIRGLSADVTAITFVTAAPPPL